MGASNSTQGWRGDGPQPLCTSCHALGGTIMSGVGVRNLYYASSSTQHKSWLLLTGGSLVAAGLYYGFYPLIYSMFANYNSPRLITKITFTKIFQIMLNHAFSHETCIICILYHKSILSKCAILCKI
jgi:hypothetical protein